MVTLSQWFYTTQLAISMLIVLFIVLFSIFTVRGVFKYILTILVVTIIMMHYILVFNLAHYETVRIYPFIILEETDIGKAISPDYGQLLLLFILLSWRREIKNMLRRRGM
ncbi:MAG: hypothetical protein QXP02_01455 [Desulfurococcaceae archaeon]